ncbi:MAG: hypothetical protein E6H53_19405 [Betaproteobacteria bacterium]|nr:MAG: hypothetical protein E6H53_19405 [Betaproteobacteria bacterium]
MGAGIAWKGARRRFYGEYEGIRIIGLREDWARRLGVFICAPLAACSTPAPIAGPILEPRIFDVREARWVSESQLVALLAAARYRLLGEVHDNPAHHEVRARLITAIAATGARPAVVFEQFDLDRDEALRAAQAAGADAEELAAAGRLDNKAWKWPLHKPILEAALTTRLPVRAGNLSRAELGGDLQAAIDKDSNAIGYARFHAAHWSEAQAAALRADIIESHCRKLPEPVVPRLVLAQRVRDAAMAQALVSDATPGGAILIAGNGHVRADLAVPVYLHAAGLADADSSSVSVGFIEATPEEKRAREFPRQVIADHPGFDYIWLTSPVARDDPCADFPVPAARSGGD